MLALLNRKTYSRAAQRATSPEDSLTSKWRGRCAKDSLEALARLAFKSRHARPACPLLPAYYNQKNRTSSTYKRIQAGAESGCGPILFSRLVTGEAAALMTLEHLTF